MEKPIGIFDSGIGGLSIWKEVQKLLPNESIVYLADNKNCPYGNKTPQEIIELSKKNTEFLISKQCKIIVVACNTATAAAIDLLRKTYNMPFVGIEPAIKPAALNTKTGVIGVLATKGTFNGKLFKQTAAKFATNTEIIVQQGNGLVEIVENDQIKTDKARELLKQYLENMINKGADKIVLGCTHYPFLTNEIKKIVPKNVDIINPAIAVAKQTCKLLKINNIESKSQIDKYEFYSTGNTETIKKHIEKLNIKNYLLNKAVV